MGNRREIIQTTRQGAMLALAVLLALTPLTGAMTASAEEPGPAALNSPAADAPQIERFEYWRARGDEAIERVAAARRALDEANAAVSRMQSRNHPRGAARLKLRQEQEHARKAYAATRHYLEVELPAEARSHGAPRHWVAERS